MRECSSLTATKIPALMQGGMTLSRAALRWKAACSLSITTRMSLKGQPVRASHKLAELFILLLDVCLRLCLHLTAKNGAQL